MKSFWLVFAFLLCLTAPVIAEERITSFSSDVTINRDGSLNVRETIEVVAEGNRIRRGIYRDFPTRYQDRHGFTVRAGFEVLSVKRNGESEPYTVESISNGQRVRIGSADRLLSPGKHRYDIVYRTTRQLGFFDRFDELYWNVTGNAWEFPIDRAVVTIRLPPGARVLQHAEYTGLQGSTARDARVLEAEGSVYRAETTRVLAPNEGFTVAVGFIKGIVAAPSGAERRQQFVSDNAGIFALLAGVLGTALYYLWAWFRVGRDPAKGTVIPLFYPPEGIGPAGARYLWKHGFDDRAFASALVGLAVKGRLKIADDDDVFTITKTSSQGPALTPSEGVLYAAIPSGTTELRQANHRAVGAMRSKLREVLVKEFEGSIFLRNRGWFWLGLVISVAVLIASALLLPGPERLLGLFMTVWTGGWWAAILAAAAGIFRGFFSSRGVFRKIASAFGLLFLIPFVIAGIAGPGMIVLGTQSPTLLALGAGGLVLIAMNFLFFKLLAAPTIAGRKLLDRLEGFRMYLATAEEDRLAALHPPEKTPELFERYLPYALALDCENEWNNKFATVLAAAAAAGATAPIWYSGSHWDAGRTGSFTDSLGSALASSTAAASSPPGSSSGSSGGGSSGGGGGGGGGGGW